MSELRIDRGKVLVDYVGGGRYIVELKNKLGESTAIEMSKEQLDTLGKSLQVIAKRKA